MSWEEVPRVWIRMEETINEHLAMIEAIGKRDPEAAEKVTRLHFKKSIVYLKQEIKKES